MNILKYKESLEKFELIPELDFLILCDKIKEILIDEPNVVHVASPVVVCGDIHG